jgi:hypothetical protein
MAINNDYAELCSFVTFSIWLFVKGFRSIVWKRNA